MSGELREKAARLPLLPGVYIFKDAAGEIIYVGKAKKLKNRVSSYFCGAHLPKVAAMAAKVSDMEVIVAGSEFEALVLENSLIKRHKPRYNILLKDDKGYPFIRLDKRAEYPVFTLSNTAPGDGARYYGPFGGRSVTKNIIDTVCKALLLPTCSRKFPRDIGRGRPCLNYDMGCCAGWCIEGGKAEDYRAAVDSAEMIISGDTKKLMAELTERMNEAAGELRFEAAAVLRDRIRSIGDLSRKQHVIAAVYADTDAVGFCRGAKTCFSVLHFTDGDLSGKDFELTDEPLEEDGEALSALLRQYYTRRGAWPGVILLPFETEDREELARLFSEAAGKSVKVSVPKRGDFARLAEAAGVNAREEAERAVTARQKQLKTLEWLGKALGLEGSPDRIEAFDISNLGNDGIVAGMTVFAGGKPLKRDYRRFRIRDTDCQDDYASMREAVGRRFRNYLEGDGKFSEKPDLLLIDGGQAHAAAALSVLNELGLDIPVFGMVKDDRHRTRAVVTPGGEEIGITANPAVFSLVGVIQEETHRYAIDYQRTLRKEALRSELDDVPGIGAKRRSALLGRFGSLRAVKAADYEQLRALLPEKAAQALYKKFHPEV